MPKTNSSTVESLTKVESKAGRTMQKQLSRKTFKLLPSCSDSPDQHRVVVVVDFVAWWGILGDATHIC